MRKKFEHSPDGDEGVRSPLLMRKKFGFNGLK